MKKKSIRLHRRSKVKRFRRSSNKRSNKRIMKSRSRSSRKRMDGYIINVDTNYTPYGCKVPKSIY